MYDWEAFAFAWYRLGKILRSLLTRTTPPSAPHDANAFALRLRDQRVVCRWKIWAGCCLPSIQIRQAVFCLTGSQDIVAVTRTRQGMPTPRQGGDVQLPCFPSPEDPLANIGQNSPP